MPETHFYWDPVEDNIVREYDEAGVVTAEYTTEPELYGNVISQRRQDEYRQFQYDAQGSTLAATDENQDVTDTFAYSAFGEVTERSGTTEVPFRYIGRKGYYTDGLTGRIVARRRLYEPARARWLSPDPIIARWLPTYYQYARNRPVSRIDPSGLLCIKPEAIITSSRCKNGPANLFEWGATILPPLDKIGFILQRISRYYWIKNCDGIDREASAACPTGSRFGYESPAPSGEEIAIPLVYWELWSVDRGSIFAGVPPALKHDFGFDTFSLEHPGDSIGYYWIEGEVMFYEGDIPPGGWRAWEVYPQQSPIGAGSLAVACEDKLPPDFIAKYTGRIEASRFVMAQWNCCPCVPQSSLFLSGIEPGICP